MQLLRSVIKIQTVVRVIMIDKLRITSFALQSDSLKTPKTVEYRSDRSKWHLCALIVPFSNGFYFIYWQNKRTKLIGKLRFEWQQFTFSIESSSIFVSAILSDSDRLKAFKDELLSIEEACRSKLILGINSSMMWIVKDVAKVKLTPKFFL